MAYHKNPSRTYLYTVYLPEPRQDELHQLNSSLQENSESASVVVVGDFTLPTLNWSPDESSLENNGGSTENNELCVLMKDNFLQQFIKGPTHIAGNKLDLLLSNWPVMIEHVSTLTPEESTFPSDHYLVNFSIWLKFKRARRVQRKAYNYKRADFQDLHRLLQNATLDIPLSDSINISWSRWKDLFLAAVEKCIPVKVIKDTNSPPWIDGEIRHLMRKKYRALKKYRKTRSEERKKNPQISK